MQFLIIFAAVLALAFAAPNPLLLHDNAVTSSVRVAVGDAIVRAEDQTRLLVESGHLKSTIIPHTSVVTPQVVPAVSTVHSRVLTSDIVPTVSAVRSTIVTPEIVKTIPTVHSTVLTSNIVPTVSAVRTSVLTSDVIPTVSTVRSGLLAHNVVAPAVSSVVSPVATVGLTSSLVNHGVRSLVHGVHGSSIVL